MPLFKTIQFNSETTILIWKISESTETLFSEVDLNSTSMIRIENMKSELRKREFLSIRKLLRVAGYSDFDLHYDNAGKPHLSDQKFISISHSHQFAAIIISDKKVGIDIEKQKEKIISIADKFSVEDLDKNVKQKYIQKLTVIWVAKEAVFKIENQPGISFKNHILVNDFEITQRKATAVLKFMDKTKLFEVYFLEIEDFVLVYVFEIEDVFFN